MNVEYLNQELTSRIDSLKTELSICERQKAVTSIIMCLRSIKEFRQGYNGVAAGMEISPEAFADFISLLSSNEYLKGHNSGGNDFLGPHPKEHNFDEYYLTLGTGIVLELSFCQTEIKGYNKPIKESTLTIRAFADSQDLQIKVDADSYERARIEILKQDGTSVFDSHTTSEYLRYDNQKLSEALLPISVEDLTNRFLDKLQNQKRTI